MQSMGDKKLSYDELEKKVQHLEEKMVKTKEESSKLKSIMLSNVHHEIRTPMNAIQGYSNLLAVNDVPAEKKEMYLNYIQQGNQRLISYIDDLIEASRLEVGDIKLNEKECSINNLFDNVYNHYNYIRRNDKQFVICLLVNKEILADDFKILTDESLLSKALFKLLKSAFDYTELGVIEFGYTLDELKLYFFMNDSRNSLLGKTHKEILSLQEFEDTRAAVTSQFDLGLTIAYKIIKQMKGRIWVQNNNEKGYSIRFELPIKIPPVARDYETVEKDRSQVNAIQ